MTSENAFIFEVEKTAGRLLAYCQDHDWAGHDPYDALNSQLLDTGRFLDSRLPRLVLTQILKRSPVNVRGLLQIPAMQNPKALALFISALVKAPSLVPGGPDALIDHLTARLEALRSPGVQDWCWGYSFPWQTRTVIVPRWTPNLVCTSFVVSALLDVYDRRRDPRYLEMATNGAEYILRDLYWDGGTSLAGFGYPLATVRTQVHNANLLAAALLIRVYRYTGELGFLRPALKVARWSVAQQRPDGSWPYGEAVSQRWIDNFHTGYVLCAMHQIDADTNSDEFSPAIAKGLRFYQAHFLNPDGAVNYFHNRKYPIDIHCIAQSIISLIALRDRDPQGMERASSVFWWARQHMWTENDFFAYRKFPGITVRISYMRWSQAWMLLALAFVLNAAGGSIATQRFLPPRLNEMAPC